MHAEFYLRRVSIRGSWFCRGRLWFNEALEIKGGDGKSVGGGGEFGGEGAEALAAEGEGRGIVIPD